MFLAYTGECERKIDECRARIRMQQESIRTRRQQAIDLRREADNLRIVGDDFCISVGGGRQEAVSTRFLIVPSGTQG